MFWFPRRTTQLAVSVGLRSLVSIMRGFRVRVRARSFVLIPFRFSVF